MNGLDADPWVRVMAYTHSADWLMERALSLCHWHDWPFVWGVIVAYLKAAKLAQAHAEGLL